VADRFPGFAVPHGYEAMFEHYAGVLFADNAVRALQDRAVRRGATLQFATPVMSWKRSGSGVEVRTANARHRADRLVITAGAWTNRLVAELGLPLVAHRVVNVSFERVDRSLFTPERLPAFIVSEGAEGAYGITRLRNVIDRLLPLAGPFRSLTSRWAQTSASSTTTIHPPGGATVTCAAGLAVVAPVETRPRPAPNPRRRP
jgi:glycine/D-amino acid oxidase-like deaminating enzyme